MSEKGTYDAIVRRAATDPDFRERLIANPAQTWQEATGITVPDNVELVVLENSTRVVHLVLPSAELTMQDMDRARARGGIRDTSGTNRTRDMLNLGTGMCTQELWEAW